MPVFPIALPALGCTETMEATVAQLRRLLGGAGSNHGHATTDTDTRFRWRFEKPHHIFVGHSSEVVGLEGQRFLQKISMLAAGSPTHFPRMFSYGLANLLIKRRSDLAHASGCGHVSAQGCSWNVGAGRSANPLNKSADDVLASGQTFGQLHMNTSFLLMSQYEGKAKIPIDQVCRDYFFHLTLTKLIRKISTGEIALPLVRIEDSQKCAKGIHLTDLARYLDQRTEIARKGNEKFDRLVHLEKTSRRQASARAD
jgi:hypothetical protein